MKMSKRIFALLIVAVWLGLILATLISALIGTDTSTRLFNGLIVADIILPVIAYAISLVYKLLKNETNKANE